MNRTIQRLAPKSITSLFAACCLVFSVAACATGGDDPPGQVNNPQPDAKKADARPDAKPDAPKTPDAPITPDAPVNSGLGEGEICDGVNQCVSGTCCAGAGIFGVGVCMAGSDFPGLGCVPLNGLPASCNPANPNSCGGGECCMDLDGSTGMCFPGVVQGGVCMPAGA